MGANGRGMLVGVTNQRTQAPADRSLLSRGQLVMDALRASSVDQIVDQLSAVDGRRYNEFNLLFGSGTTLYVAYGRRDSAAIEIASVPPGVGVLPNDRIGAGGFPKAERAKRMIEPHQKAPWHELVGHLGHVLADHLVPDRDQDLPAVGQSPLSDAERRSAKAICVHGEHYGTRSSTIMAVNEGRVGHYLFSPGAPCATAFDDLSALL